MNIGFYIPQLFGGGAERVVTSLANTLARLGHNIIVITTVRHKEDYLLEDGVKRILLDEMRLCRWSILNKILRFRRLRTICKEEQLDVLIAFLGGAVNYSVLAGLGLRTKIVVSERNSPTFTYQSRLSQFWAKIIFSLSDGVVFQTGDAQMWFPKIVQRKSIVIPNPVKDVFYSHEYSNESKVIVEIEEVE